MNCQNGVKYCLGKRYGIVITLQARLYNKQPDLLGLVILIKASERYGASAGY